MSVPKSKVLSVNKGFGFNASFKNNSPSQNVIVNVGAKPQSSEPERYDKKHESVNEKAAPASDVKVIYDENNPYVNMPADEQIQSRSIDTANESIEDIKAIINDKERMIEALSLILDLIENNPILINKYIIPERNVLLQLIHLLTNADEIRISELDPDVGCGCRSTVYHIIDKIYVVNGNETSILKYKFPGVIELLDKHKISTKTFYIDE
jgi:hypothetical protein